MCRRTSVFQGANFSTLFKEVLLSAYVSQDRLITYASLARCSAMIAVDGR